MALLMLDNIIVAGPWSPVLQVLHLCLMNVAEALSTIRELQCWLPGKLDETWHDTALQTLCTDQASDIPHSCLLTCACFAFQPCSWETCFGVRARLLNFQNLLGGCGKLWASAR